VDGGDLHLGCNLLTNVDGRLERERLRDIDSACIRKECKVETVPLLNTASEFVNLGSGCRGYPRTRKPRASRARSCPQTGSSQRRLRESNR
jgi:hypothetical protein